MLTKADNHNGREGGQTLAGIAFDRIRSDILSCRLEPDARLRMDRLKARYEMGLSPLREALMRLEAEGLVILEQKKGFRVAPVSQDHLIDLGRIRAEIECLALKWAIEHGDVAWEADIIGAFHKLSRQNKISPDTPMAISEDWNAHHRAFHWALVAACGSPVLLSMLVTLYDQAQRYVALSIANRDKPRDDVAEHKGLMEAALARDGGKACALCKRHIEITTNKVAASLDRLEAA